MGQTGPKRSPKPIEKGGGRSPERHKFDEKGPSYINFPLVFCGPERKLRLRVKNDTGYIDLSLGVYRRRPNNANHDGEMGQITYKSIENKKKRKKTHTHKKYIKMRIPSWDYTGVLDHHSGVILPRRRPKNANHDG